MTTPYPPELAAILARLDDDRRPQEAASDQAVRLIAADWLDERATGGEPCGLCRGRGGPHAVNSDQWYACPDCSGTGVVADGYSDYAAFLRLMAREVVCPEYIEGASKNYRHAPWIWGTCSPAPKYLCGAIGPMVFAHLPLHPGRWGEGYRNEGRTSLWSYHSTRDRAERALHAAWVASGRPATLRG